MPLPDWVERALAYLYGYRGPMTDPDFERTPPMDDKASEPVETDDPEHEDRFGWLRAGIGRPDGSAPGPGRPESYSGPYLDCDRPDPAEQQRAGRSLRPEFDGPAPMIQDMDTTPMLRELAALVGAPVEHFARTMSTDGPLTWRALPEVQAFVMAAARTEMRYLRVRDEPLGRAVKFTVYWSDPGQRQVMSVSYERIREALRERRIEAPVGPIPIPARIEFIEPSSVGLGALRIVRVRLQRANPLLGDRMQFVIPAGSDKVTVLRLLWLYGAVLDLGDPETWAMLHEDFRTPSTPGLVIAEMSRRDARLTAALTELLRGRRSAFQAGRDLHAALVDLRVTVEQTGRLD